MLPPDLGQDPLASGPAGGTTLFDERHTNRASFSPYGDDEEVADAILESADGDHDQPDDGFLVKSGGTAKGFGADLLDGADAATEPVSHASHDLHHLVHDDIEDAIIDDEPHGHTAETIESTAPRGREADLLCEILGVEPGATWAELRAAHAAAMSEYDPRLESDEDRIALAWAIRREMNSTYATLRLLAAA
ncbi:MAG: hypothetical protein R2710_11315 [Acidimicrobiales bacterium]